MGPLKSLETALPVLIVAVVTQLTLVVRSSLENRKTRRFLRADLATEARESLRGLDLFLASCNGADVTDVNQLGLDWPSQLRRSNARRNTCVCRLRSRRHCPP